MRLRVILLSALAGLFVAPLARAEKPLQQQYLDIYLKINEAEQMEHRADYRGALQDFKDCYEKLSTLNREHPEWEAALILHRMDDCKAKIIELQPKADAQPETTNVQNPALNADVGGNPQTAEAGDLQQKLEAALAELDVTKQKLQQANAQSDAYRSELAAANQQIAALKNAEVSDDKMSRLLAENKQLTDKLANTEKELDGFRNNPKSRLAQAETEVKNLQDQLAASQEANQALQDTTTTLKQQLDQANSDLVAANQKLAASGPGSTEYLQLKHENEIMRNILTRELQEQGRRDMAKKLIEEEFDNLKLKSSVLQEHLDEATTVMTPPTTDEERALLASLRPSSPDVSAPPAPANSFSAPAGPGSVTTGDTNAAPSTVTPPNTSVAVGASATGTTSTTSTPDNSTNAAPVQIVMNGPDATQTNAPSTSGTDTSTPGVTVSSGSSTTTTTPDTSSAPIPPASIPGQPPPPPPANVSTATSTPPVPDKTVSQVPPAQTDVTTTTTTTTTSTDTTTPDNANDPSALANKPRLPDDMRETAQEAADLFKNQKYDESAAKYQSIIDKYPESLYAWSNLGVVRFQQGKFDEALKALQQAVKLSPTDAFSYSNLGIVYYQLNQFENAIDALNAAKALDPNDPKTHNYLGCACSQKGWSEVAEKEFRKAIELDPNFGDAHFNLALVYATQKPPLVELARREYNRALELGIAKDPRLEKLLNEPSPDATAQTQPVSP